MTTIKNDTRIIAIIGGGITGLAAAYAVQQAAKANHQPISFVLIEAEQRLGGKIITDQVEGFTIEGGPDCFLRQKPWASELCLKLGLGKALLGTNDHQRKVYVVNRGRLTPLPDGVMLIVPTRIMPFVTSSLISWPGKLRMGMDLFIPPWRGEGDESVGNFVRRRLGSEALDKIAEPLMSGIHVSDPEEQSLLGTFPRFRALEQKHGSLIKGMLASRRQAAAHKQAGAPSPASTTTPSSLFISLENGMGQMVTALEDQLFGGDIRLGMRVTGLKPLPGGGYRLEMEKTQTGDLSMLEADALILATPAFVSAGLLEPFAPGVSRELKAICYVSTATLSLAYRKQDIHKPFMGFGFVSPRKERRKLSACTWTSYKFNHRAPDDALLLRCFFGGPGKEDQVELSDGELVEMARSELKDILGITAEPFLARVYRWRKANPQYAVGHLERVQKMRNELVGFPGLFLAGGAYEGVGIPDCVRQGQEAAKVAMKVLLDTAEPFPV